VKRSPLKRRTPLTARRLDANRAAAKKAAAAKLARRVPVVCRHCGTEFMMPPSLSLRRKFCSQACMGASQRKVRTASCAICGEAFERPPRTLRKTCSAACKRELLRQSKLGRNNPSWTGRQHAGDKRWVAALADCCALCGSSRRLQRHHVIYEQHVRRRGGDCFHPDDCLTLCFNCHVAHHRGRGGRIRVSQLRPENIEFACALLGAYARDYFVRYYDLDCDLLGEPDPMVVEWMPEGDASTDRPGRGERGSRRKAAA
jgi:hypothetical protein